ncbi:TPA: hypothetical protein N0H38_004461 [Pseudomonas aeruginosa]|nr:hypothetical protein [Pseudomonas aeruginosa]HCK4574101.1 hypothetical protein [Pseudomonas aeruginosa]HCK4790544.1 hypothetical protein [Pseudomonas aeruginosa]HCK4799644.1 hypothetical protein [Pseudomonas aeruginosa]HCK5645960.1 hypothetical protein [Pseudomonas aeruginosa]
MKLRHLLLYVPVLSGSLGRQLDFAMLIGQVTRVRYFDDPFRQVQEAENVSVVHQRLANVIDLTAPIFTARVRQEQDPFKGDGTRSQIVKHSIRVLPDTVEFGLDENARYLPECPACQLFSAMYDDVLWHDAEAFQQWLISQGLVWN